MLKSCKVCGKEMVGKRSHAKYCTVECANVWYRANSPARYKPVPKEEQIQQPKRPDLSTEERTRRNHIWAKYKLTWEEYLKLYETQHGRCAICKDALELFTTKSTASIPHVDHDHTTGKVRGLLCKCCNTGLGVFKDNKVSLINAIEYLEKSVS